MSVRTIASLTIFCLSTWLAASAQSAKETSMPNMPSMNMNTAQPQTEPHSRAHAKAKITVQSSEAKPYDQTAKPALMELRLSETFTGDIDGESPVRALQVQLDDKSARQVSIQRFRGKLGGRQGTFVLQGSE